jgi:glycosyltransferase involved in cell wall biosynthesis
LARLAYKILEDPQLRARLGAAGRERVLGEFSVQKMVDAHAALYRELLG